MSPPETLPLLSVVMPVRNALPYINESVESILNQTFKDFEFIIFDDASTDGSLELLREWAQRDARIRLYENREKSLGLSGSANFVVRKSSAPIIARMDADDISHPERLRRQLDVMLKNADVALVGTLFEGIDDKGRSVRPRDRWRLARSSVFPPFPHGSVMFRREAFEAVGGYRERCAGWEDQDIFLRMRRRARILVISDTLYRYRFQVNSATVSIETERSVETVGLRQRCLEQFRQSGDYTRLLEETNGNGNGHAYDANALADSLYLQGSMRLWAGYPPRILGVMYRHKSFSLSRRALRTLAWGAWAAINPSSLRLFLRSVIHARDFLASSRVKDEEVYEWRLK